MTLPSLQKPLLLASFLAATAVAAADPPLARFSFEERQMGTRFRLLVYAPDQRTADAAARKAFDRVAELNRIMSDYDPTSELMRLCARAGGPPVVVSDDLFRVLEQAQKIAEESQGAFDVSIGPLVRLWRRSRRTQKLPDPEKLAAARARVGYKNIVLDAGHTTVQLQKEGMLLDLGGIAKGYAADQALAVLRQQGLTRALVAAGGDIAVADPPPDTPAWRVAIQPLPGETGTGLLLLQNAAVSTSGDAEQFVAIGGKRYSHIVDPRTGLGLVGRMSATVVAPRGILADSLTKVLCILGPEQGFKIVESHKGVSGRMIYENESSLHSLTSPRFPPLVRPDGASPPPERAQP